MRDPSDLLHWTEWRTLQGASRDPAIPRVPGLYRIRRVGRDDLDYIGQTGLSLRQRLGMLRGIYGEAMPYADPHTAAPALWAVRDATGCAFEVSVAPVEGSTPWRKGLEAVEIALYRQEYGASPTVEFGRMPAGYCPSSGNTARLVAAGKRVRGERCDGRHERHESGIAPSGPLTGDPQSAGWGGYVWSRWVALRELGARPMRPRSGLYRIRGDDEDSLLYVGQGRIPDRPLAHFGKVAKVDHRQGCIFAGQQRLGCSWVINDTWLAHQRLELENDLIAAHIVQTRSVPAAQFLG
jgi:hypothetical protein